MKYQSFCMRALCLLLIIAAAAGYNSMQAKNEEVQTSQETAALTKRVETLEKQQEEMLAALKEAAENQEKTAKEQKETADEETKTDVEEKEEESENFYKNGTYTGEAQGFGGTIQVQLTLEDDTIKDIQITSASGEDSAYLSQAQSVISSIISAQSTDVDTVSGATFSSTGIINAAADALGKAAEE